MFLVFMQVTLTLFFLAISVRNILLYRKYLKRFFYIEVRYERFSRIENLKKKLGKKFLKQCFLGMLLFFIVSIIFGILNSVFS